MQKAKKGIMSAKTFGRAIETYEELSESVATYTTRIAEKLRKQKTMASQLAVFVRSSYFRKDPFYEQATTRRLPHPSAFTPTLIHYALDGLNEIYKPGVRYMKAGVYITRIVPEQYLQPPIFGPFSIEERERQARLMLIVDAVNRKFGPGTLSFGACGISPTWKMRQLHRSPRYTTQ